MERLSERTFHDGESMSRKRKKSTDLPENASRRIVENLRRRTFFGGLKPVDLVYKILPSGSRELVFEERNEAPALVPVPKEIGRLDITIDLGNPEGSPFVGESTIPCLPPAVAREMIRAAARHLVNELPDFVEAATRPAPEYWTLERLLKHFPAPEGTYLVLQFAQVEELPASAADSLRTATYMDLLLNLEPRYSPIHLVENALRTLLRGSPPFPSKSQYWSLKASLTKEPPPWHSDRVRSPTPSIDIPLLSDTELPPRPSDGRASKVERRIKASELPAAFERIEAELTRLHDPVVKTFQRVLDVLHRDGKACASFEDNQELTRRILQIADRFGIRLFFDAPDQKRYEVRVRCGKGHGSAAGEFRVETAEKQRTHLDSSPTWPPLIADRQ
jgi:hypothetical protein